MPTDLKITELPLANTLSGDDVSVLVNNNTDYQFTLAKLLQFVISNFPANNLGSTITFSTDPPQNNTGKNGDVVILPNNQTFYQKINGVWTQRYQVTSAASNTPTGSNVLYGYITPGIDTGNINDTYINTGTGVFYKKTATGWTQVFSMLNGPAGGPGPKGDTGVPGINGKTILHGPTNPSNQSIGTDGDFYINTTYYTLFGPKTNGDWGMGIGIVDNIDAINQLTDLVGNLTTLTTTNKNSIVAAINEVKAEVEDNKFTKDIPIKLATGRYLGPYKDGDTIPAKNKTPFEVFQMLATEVVHPTYTKPAATLTSLQTSGPYEVGLYVPITFNLAYDPKDGGAATGYTIKKAGNIVSTSNTYLETLVVSTAAISYQGNIAYNAGPIKKNNLQEDDSTGQIQADSVDSSIITFRGYYAMRFGSVATAAKDSNGVRALPTMQLTSQGNTFTISTGIENKTFQFWLPTGKNLISVIDQDTLNANITSSYQVTNLNVNDAAGNPVAGKLYTLTNAAAYSANHRHQVTTS